MEESKKAAAQAAFNDFVTPLLLNSANKKSGTSTRPIVIGIGSGSTIVYLIEILAKLRSSDSNSNSEQTKQQPFICIPTSFQSRQLLIHHNLPVGDLDTYPDIDLTIDGADEVDKHLNCVKGGGGCQTQEKVVAFNSKTLVIIADERKNSDTLGEKVFIEYLYRG
jgi:ribose 5-phosphate isomerase A